MTKDEFMREWRKLLEVQEVTRRLEWKHGYDCSEYIIYVIHDLLKTLDGDDPIERTGEYLRRFEVPSGLDKHTEVGVKLGVVNIKCLYRTYRDSIEK
jgi:hypothetical protein